MRTPTLVTIVSFLIFLSRATASGPPVKPLANPADDKETIRKGLSFVETKSLTWLRERKCASCHHVPMMVWVQRDARQRGFKIDEKGLQEATDFLLAPDNRAGIVPNPGDKERTGVSFPPIAVYTILAFRTAGASPQPAVLKPLKQAADHVMSRQQAGGSWQGMLGRPPIFDREEAATLLATLGIATEPSTSAGAVAHVTKARQWLTTNSKDDNQQALCLRILLDHNRKASVEQLLKRQNPDGGWSQTREMASDAYATGQAIYALVSRGGIDRNDLAIVKARDFLRKTQKPDGSWAMTSRPPNNGNGKGGAGNLEPITVAGSAWAVLGLLQLTPPVSP